MVRHVNKREKWGHGQSWCRVGASRQSRATRIAELSGKRTVARVIGPALLQRTRPPGSAMYRRFPCTNFAHEPLFHACSHVVLERDQLRRHVACRSSIEQPIRVPIHVRSSLLTGLPHCGSARRSECCGQAVHRSTLEAQYSAKCIPDGSDYVPP